VCGLLLNGDVVVYSVVTVVCLRVIKIIVLLAGFAPAYSCIRLHLLQLQFCFLKTLSGSYYNWEYAAAVTKRNTKLQTHFHINCITLTNYS